MCLRDVAKWLLDAEAHRLEFIGLLPKDVWHMILCSFITLRIENEGQLRVTRFFGLRHNFGTHASAVSVSRNNEFVNFRTVRYIFRLGTLVDITHTDEFPTIDECRAALRRDI